MEGTVVLRFTWYSSTGNTLFSDEIDDKKG